MVSKDEIKHLGWLSRLELTDKDLDRYVSQIDEIIRYFDKLDTVSLVGSEPASSMKKVSELRKDDIHMFEGDPLEFSKNRKDGFVKGPKMI
ncbi:MAG: Asp-tRNA(Asn)/Glu-tRNA(Gln) amidotransferase subunit GatC [Candidatus Nitrosopolaris sp.]|jgi:aspartyl-tRNA(Asn)/glutamyl-tRNA(Gln) amidotransferase subunit C